MQPSAELTLPSDEERALLRDSIRGFLAQNWPAAGAVERGRDPAELRRLWKQIAGQGLTALGSDPAEGGVRELVVVMQELGRAACPLPLADAALLNLMSRSSPASGTLTKLIDSLHTGAALPCLSFGASDHDRNTGSVVVSDARANGRVSFVEGARVATQFGVVIEDARTLALIRADGPGVQVTPTRALGADSLCQVEFERSRADCIRIDRSLVQDLLSLSRLAYSARAWGAASRSFELLVPYVKERRQFGRAIGGFQAVQHRLADILIKLEAVRLSLDNAAAHHDRRVDHWRGFAAAACAFANTALREVSLATHHTFGAIGYAEDHEAPRHFKRVHLDVLRHGGGRQARDELAARYLDNASCEFPEYDLGNAADRKSTRLNSSHG